MVKTGTTTKLDPHHIYIVGFWSSGNSPIVIDKVFLSNSTEYDPTTGINEITVGNPDQPEFVDVFTILGVKIRSQVKREYATRGLPNGIYLVGAKKVVVINNN
jgi:hypothetical protein